MIYQILLKKNALFVETTTTQQRNVKKERKNKENARADGDLDRQRTKCPPCNFFVCISVDHIITK